MIDSYSALTTQFADNISPRSAEPDKSNPTRSRWERPLDTIRSFEAAIEGPQAQRASARNGSGMQTWHFFSLSLSLPVALLTCLAESDWNRRESYYPPRSNGPSRPPSIYSMVPNPQRHPPDNYYGNRPQPYVDARPSPPVRDSYHEASQQSAFGTPNGSGGYGSYSSGSGVPYSTRQPGSRSHLGPMYNVNRKEPNDVYTLQNRDRSYETVTSASGSGISGDQGSYRTDPSSDNNSAGRASPPKPPVPAHDYGIGFNNTSTYQPAAFTVGPKSTGSRIVKKPVPGTVGSPPTGTSVLPKAQPVLVSEKPAPGKRKSWLFRRFSKNA